MRNHSAISAITTWNNKTLAQLKVCIVMSIHNMEKVVVLNMLIVIFLNISIIALIVPFINLR